VGQRFACRDVETCRDSTGTSPHIRPLWVGIERRSFCSRPIPLPSFRTAEPLLTRLSSGGARIMR
jgi:hypothetical protein